MMKYVLCQTITFLQIYIFRYLGVSRYISANFIRIGIHSYYITVIISRKPMEFIRHVQFPSRSSISNFHKN